VNEELILKKIRRWCEPTSLNSTIVGVGDDAAVLSPSGRPLVFASDLSIENVHFDFRFSCAEDLGYKSIARVLSDIAAMGAEPMAVTISIALSKSMVENQIDDFLDGFFQGAVAVALETKCALAGGDMTRAETPIVIDIAAIGELRTDANAWLRSGAKPGDDLFVTGDLGGAAFALEQFRLGRRDALSLTQAQKHLRPRPRFDVAASLKPEMMSEVRAAIDISDGLVRDAYRLCAASGVSLAIFEESLKLSPGASIKQAMTGGDDYELILAVAPHTSRDLVAVLNHVGAYKLGTFSAPDSSNESAVYLRHKSGTQTLLASSKREAGGHDPFRDM
jgi:thiamine-monophosphate kinase